jgi:hypothetical protein
MTQEGILRDSTPLRTDHLAAQRRGRGRRRERVRDAVKEQRHTVMRGPGAMR